MVVPTGRAEKGALTVQRLAPGEFKQRVEHGGALLLDVRRSGALARDPNGIAGAVPVLLDDADPKIPDVDRNTPMLVYCLCSGQASSTRVALWLAQAGYRDVAVLAGGLPAWLAAKYPTRAVSLADRRIVEHWMSAARFAQAAAPEGSTSLIAESAFLAGQKLPTRREMAVVFVDMVDSTSLLSTRSAEEVLALVQAFMEVVVAITVQHCGDVHDFEGDGAMLYFAGPGEAVPAAFNLRDALSARRAEVPALPQARIALDSGALVVGYVGTHDRRGLSFIGPSINTAARILKLAPPGGIVATQAIVQHARRSDPDLASRFEELPERQHLKGFDQPVSVFVAKPDARCQEHCA
ncbi:MAG: rhodanese-like domain-containing protein [Gammaproteobacteria bacterium]